MTPLRTRSYGTSESWSTLMMFDATTTTEQELRDAYQGFYGNPGASFAHPPAVYRQGRYFFVWYTGGLDI